MKDKNIHDVIIVGAGAAGLSCARELFLKKRDFLLIEARSRVGGRVFSSGSNELGAEFIHGAPAQMIKDLESFNIGFYDVQDDHFLVNNKNLRYIPDYWDKLQKITDRLGKGRDQSVQMFLEKTKIPKTEKRIFKSYVEGFHNADLSKMSQKGLAEAEQTAVHGLNGAQLFRPLQPYSNFLEKIFQSFASKENFKLRTVLKKIDWRPGLVKLVCASEFGDRLYFCKKLVLTVPIGVLKSSSIIWDPLPNVLERSLEAVEMGHVVRINFQFKSRFWENFSKKPLSFLHLDPEELFPTWWSLQPLRSPRLIAWQGGPRALEISRWSAQKQVETALRSLSKLFNRPLSFIKRQVVSWEFHNWSADAYSRGAYSYITTGGVRKALLLGKPISKTIYFCGEGTVAGSNRGTVNGALDSGRKTAKQI